MLSKSKKKFIRSLEHKKYRAESGCFLAEGNKLVSDLLPHFECEILVTTSSWLATQGDVYAKELILIEPEEMTGVSLLRNPQDVLAVFKQIPYEIREEDIRSQLSLVLDDIQDPGNLGTIVRLADWFGIENIICSPSTTDIYNPKTIQATMGALARVKVHYLSLSEFLSPFPDLPIYGTYPEGENIYNRELSSTGLIIMGNEGNGINPELEKFITQKLFIPNFPPGKATSESLNVAMATGIVCAEFRRKQLYTI